MTTADEVLERPVSATKPPRARKTPAAAAVEQATTPAPAAKLPNASLVLVEQTLAKYDAVEAGLADLEKKYKGTVYAVATATGMEEAKAARIAIRDPRYAVDKAAKAAKAPLNALKKDIDERALSITNRLVELETPIHEQIRAEEDRVAAEKEAAKAVAAAKAAAAQKSIDFMRNTVMDCVSKSSEEIADLQLLVEAIDIDLEVFGDRSGEALQAQQQAIEQMNKLHAAAVEREARDAAAAETAAQLKKMQDEQAERDRVANEEREQQATAERERQAEETRAAAAKLEDERRAFRAEQEEARQAREAEENRLAAERRELEEKQSAQQRERDEAENALIASLWQGARRIEHDTVPYILKAKAAFETAAKDWENDPRPRVAEAVAMARAEMKQKLEAATEREEHAENQRRIDQEATERREREEAAHAADQLRRNASGDLLEALQAVMADEAYSTLDAAVRGIVQAAVTKATEVQS